jgi:hypothetical protein
MCGSITGHARNVIRHPIIAVELRSRLSKAVLLGMAHHMQYVLQQYSISALLTSAPRPWHFPSWQITDLKLSDFPVLQNCIVRVFATFSHRKRDRKAVPDSVLHILSACLYKFGWLGCFLIRILANERDTTVSDTTLSSGKFLYRECHECSIGISATSANARSQSESNSIPQFKA